MFKVIYTDIETGAKCGVVGWTIVPGKKSDTLGAARIDLSDSVEDATLMGIEEAAVCAQKFNEVSRKACGVDAFSVEMV